MEIRGWTRTLILALSSSVSAAIATYLAANIDPGFAPIAAAVGALTGVLLAAVAIHVLKVGGYVEGGLEVT